MAELLTKEIGAPQTTCHVCRKNLKGVKYLRVDSIARGTMGRPVHLSLCKKCLSKAALKVCPELLLKHDVITELI